MTLSPVRRIGMSHRSITGKHISKKNHAVLQFESTLEKDFLVLLEFDHSVKEFGVQPLKIYYNNAGYSTRYTPDVLVYYHENLDLKPVIYEVKYAAELEEKKDEYAARFKAAEKYATENGYLFKVITEKEIRTDRLWNVKFLSPYQNGLLETECKKLILGQLEMQTTLTPQHFLQKKDLKTDGKMLNTLWQLLLSGLICCDMTKRITMNTPIWKNRNQ